MNTPFNFLHLLHTPRLSGAETLVYDLAIRHRREGHTVAIASFAAAESSYKFALSELIAAGVELYIPSRRLTKFERVAHFRRALRLARPDVVFAHSVLPSLYGRLSLPIMLQRPKFVTVLHSASNDDFSDPYLRLLERVLRRRADCVVGVSDGGARAYKARFGEHPPVHTIKNGIDLDKFRSPNRSSARERLGLRDDLKVLLQVGRLSPVKRQELSIDVLCSLLAEGGSVELWLAGLTEEKSYEEHLRRLVSSRSIENRVRFLGSRTDVAELLAAADLYLMPSEAEAHSIAFMEALASPIPILASDIEAFQFASELEGVSLLRIDPKEFAREAKKLLARGIGPIRSIERFDITRTAQDYLLLAQQLLPASASASSAQA